jgi:Cdc6-like AAA superfamily ATPase
MAKNYWIVSPNATNDLEEAPDWKEAILEHGIVFMGWGRGDKHGDMFIDTVRQGDVILVAQGANRNKEVFICGEVASDAVKEYIPDTPGEVFNRKLGHVVPKEQLEKLGLDFSGAAYGDANLIPAIYRLYPESNPSDLQITRSLDKAINQIKAMQSLDQIKELLKLKPQIILQGPPGTGKTHTAKQLAHQLIFGSPLPAAKEEQRIQMDALLASGQMELVQFHPSYSYEDFVRGITAKTVDNLIAYKTENKIMADFAERAWKNLEDSTKDSSELSREEFFDTKFREFVEQVDRKLQESGPIQLTNAVELDVIDDDAFITHGKGGWQTRLLFSQIKALFLHNITKREEILKHPELARHVMQRTRYYLEVLIRFRTAFPYTSEQVSQKQVEKKNFVLIIDEINRANLPDVLGELIYALEYRGEFVKSMYELEAGESRLVIPSNLYIIGTMNTADRSIGHMDYAIRRRFGFVDILPNQKYVPAFAQALFREVSRLFINNYDTLNWGNPLLETSNVLAADFKPEFVWLGHSYFMAANEMELALKLEYEIKPLLKEYLREGILLSSAQEVIAKLHV